MVPTQNNNFARVFELPEQYPQVFCFSGGPMVPMRMVDWFNPWPTDNYTEDGELPQTWDEVKQMLRPFLMAKNYIIPGRRYILITDFGESMMFGDGI